MALGTTVTVNGSPHKQFDSVAPMSATSGWFSVIDAGGMDDQDAATITNPTTQITASTRHLIYRNAFGTNLMLRMGYDDGLTTVTDPVVKVFGRTGNTEIWQLLKTRSGAITGTITTQASDDGATDVTDGTYLYTTPDYDATTWDCFGCEYILVGVQTVLAGTGTVTTAFLQGKFF